MRKMRLPVHLKDSTCTITDIAADTALEAVLLVCLIVTALVAYLYGSVRVGQRELRISKASSMGAPKLPAGVKAPTGIPQSYEDHLRLLADLVVPALPPSSRRTPPSRSGWAGSSRPP